MKPEYSKNYQTYILLHHSVFGSAKSLERDVHKYKEQGYEIVGWMNVKHEE